MAARLQECAVSPRPFAATLARIDWTLFHTINTSVATRDWLEDPLTALGAGVVPLFAFATVGLWFLARPYGDARWKMACMSGLVSAAVALLANHVVLRGNAVHRMLGAPVVALVEERRNDLGGGEIDEARRVE